MLKVSGHSITRRSRPTVGSCAPNSLRKLRGAKRAMSRPGAMPAMALAMPLNPGVCVTKFVKDGSAAASGAQRPTMPIEYAWTGRVLCS